MNTRLKNWATEFREEFRYVESCEDQPNENLHSYSLSDEELAQVASVEFSEFIEAHFEIISNGVKENATFYAWYDDMAGQFRFSVISGHSNELPFSCHIEDASLLEIVDLFKDKNTHRADGSPLKVWKKHISSRCSQRAQAHA